MAGFFDDADVVSTPTPASQPDTVQKSASPSSFFDQEDVVSTPPPPVQKSAFFDSEDVVNPVPPIADSRNALQKEVEDKSFFDRPGVWSKPISQDEVNATAKEFGVPAEELQSRLTVMGGTPAEGYTPVSAVKRALGFVGESVLLGVPQKLERIETGYFDPNLEKALDRIHELAQGRQSYAEMIAGLAAPAGAIGAGTKTLGGAIVKGAAIGSIAGASSARRGQELQGAETGAIVGGVTGGAVHYGIGKLASRSGAVTEAEQKEIGQVLGKNQADIDRGTEEVLSSREKSEADIDSVIRGETDQLSDPASVVKEQMAPEQVEKFLSDGTAENASLKRQLGLEPDTDIHPEALERRLARNITEQRATDFAEKLNPESSPKTLAEAQDVIEKWGERQGGDQAIAEKYRLFSEDKAALDYIRNSGILQTRGDKFQEKALNFLSDAQFVIRDIDQRFGTSAEKIHRDLNSSMNRLSFARGAARKQLADIEKLNRPIDSELLQGEDVYRALDTGDTSALNSQQQQAYQGFRDYFKKGLNFANNLVKNTEKGEVTPLSIPSRANYVPHMMLSTEDLSVAFDRKLKQALSEASRSTGRDIQDLAQLTGKQVKALSNQEGTAFSDLAQGLGIMAEGKEARDGADMSRQLKGLFNTSEGRQQLQSVARAALERQGEIPEWMREKNLYKLADRWTTNTLKHLYLRRDMDRLSSVANRVESAGGEMEAGYIRRLLGDLNGVRKGSAAEMSLDRKLGYLRAIDRFVGEKPGPIRSAIGATAKAIPEVMSDMVKQIYPNVLGMSPRAIIMNATQPLTKTAPELGTRYGYTTLMRGYVHTLLNFSKQGERLERLGFSPAEFVPKFRRAVADGIRRSSIYAIPSEKLAVMSDVAMKLYSKLDTLNRSIALSTADMMASDLAKGNRAAVESLKKMPASLQRQVERLRVNGDYEGVADAIGSHLNASTQYNYNRASMSEWGRSMGPLFSTFSKWPTATAGEIIEGYRSKGLIGGTMRNAEKFIYPLVALQLMDSFVFGEQEGEMQTDRKRKVLSKYGLSQSAPLGAAKGIIKGDFFTPPVVDALMKGLVIPSMEGDSGKVMKGVDSAISNFTPGAVWVRFLTDDLVTLMTGERPEGSTFIERTQEGARILRKKFR